MKADLVQFILSHLEASTPVMLLQVVFSEGSSPGRQGFQMAVSLHKNMIGSIGGGIMEQKLIDWSITRLENKESDVILKYQYHDKTHTKEQSGMICSGYQVIAFLPFYKKDQKLFEAIMSSIEQDDNRFLIYSPTGLAFHSDEQPDRGFQFTDDQHWSFSSRVNDQQTIHIIGAGHVSLALSELMHFLGFYIKLYDDRKDLKTFSDNTFCHEKQIVNYKTIEDHLESSPLDFIVIMTFGYRSDKIVLQQLLHTDCAYLGMMGSQVKIETLRTELLAEGIDPSILEKVDMPIGIRLNSKTPQEIAVSIAAEIIRHKNEHL